MNNDRVLVIDDERFQDYTIPKGDYIARDAFDGMKQLAENGPWGMLMIDHDLATFDKDGKEVTGYDILCWLEQNEEFLPHKIVILSSNPVGRANMQRVIDSIRRRRENG